MNLTLNVNLIHFKMEELIREEHLAMMPLSGANQTDLEELYNIQTKVSHLYLMLLMVTACANSQPQSANSMCL